MGEVGKQIWAVISVAIAGALAIGISLGLYNGMFLLPPWMDIFTENFLYTAIVGIVVFPCVAIVLFKGIHPN